MQATATWGLSILYLLVVRYSLGDSAAVCCTIFVQVNIYVTELKSEALKERHWKDLMRRLRVHWVMTDLTLGQVWDVDLQRNEGIVKDVILVAQGEMGLEVFLRQVRLGRQSQGIGICASTYVPTYCNPSHIWLFYCGIFWHVLCV